jgi:predicted Zn-dependent peptidase
VNDNAGGDPSSGTAPGVPGPALSEGGDPEDIGRTTLPNGIRVVTERMAHARSVALGIWVGIGGRDEPPALSGASHFLEHLLFKGTAERDARAIALAVDAAGGEMNAFTAREYTAYYVRLPSVQLGFGLDLLADVVSAPSFRPAEVESERQVILEEILMNEDDPDDRVHTGLLDGLFPDHPLGREVLGSPDTIAAITRDEIADFHAGRYRPANLVVAAAGDLHHDEVVERIAANLGHLSGGERPDRAAPTAAPRPLTLLHRATEQAHLAIGWRGLDHHDDDRYALALGNQVLGGGMSSRLFHEIREKRGLVYGVYSSPSSYSDSGALVVGTGTAPSRTDEVLRLIHHEVERLADDGISDEELAVAKGSLEGSLVLGLEDPGSRLGRVASSETVLGEIIPVAEHLRRLDAVTLDDVARVVKRVLTGPKTMSVVGPFDADDLAPHL